MPSAPTPSTAVRKPFPWEASYPPNVAWDAPLAISTLPALFDEAVARFAARTAIEFRDRRIAFETLSAEAGRFAAALLRRGFAPGTRVALYLPNTVHHPIAFFGVAKAGGVVVHLSPLDAPRELAHKVADSDARLLVTTDLPSLLPNALRLLDEGLVETLVVCEERVWGGAAGPELPLRQDGRVVGLAAFCAGVAGLPAALPRPTPDDIALLQYTGGTTGRPKGAMLSHGNLTSAVSIYDTWFGGAAPARSAERVICVLPLFHIYALTTILLRQIRNGHEILLHPRFDVETILRDIEEKRATSFPGVPTMWIALANHPGIEGRDFSSLLSCSSGGAPLPVEVAERFRRLTGLRLGGGWGMTETSPAGTNLPRTGSEKPGSIGVPMPGVELDVVALDDPTRVLPPGVVGELRVRGPNVTRGYWKRPEETAAAFVGDRFLTGDIGTMDAEGWFFIHDRKKDMIISGGFNVYPQMIEQAIYEHPSVAEVLVVGVPDPYRGEAAKAFVALRPGAAPFTLDELKQFLADRVGRHEMPAALELRDALPRTVVGKLSKVELREEERRRAAASAQQGDCPA